MESAVSRPTSTPATARRMRPATTNAEPQMNENDTDDAIEPRTVNSLQSRRSRPVSLQSGFDTNSIPSLENGRKNSIIAFVLNLVVLVASLMLIGVGLAFVFFYRIHMLEVITLEFLLVPLIMLGGGLFLLVKSLFVFYTLTRSDSCLMITHAVLTALAYVMLLTGLVCSVSLLFQIQAGMFNADVVPEMTLYEINPWVRHKWDTLQREFSCCGGYGYTSGYQDWKHTVLGGAHNSVPDSCCLQPAPMCGRGLFALTDIRVVITKIHTHGCLTTMMRRLDTHVQALLIAFAIGAAVLAKMELLNIFLACRMASNLAKEEDLHFDLAYVKPNHHHLDDDRMSRASSNRHETAF